MDTHDLPVVRLGDHQTSALRDFFFREHYLMQSPGEVVRWWEKRRLAFNAGVGLAGLTSVAVIYAAAALGPGSRIGDGPPLMAIIAYGVMANFMYTGGWIAELVLRPMFKERTPVVGATIFRYGFAFSVALSLLPIPVATLGLVARTLNWMFG